MKPPHTSPGKSSSRRSHGWKLLLILPYLALCFPGLYARSTPSLAGFPFFYWYQLLWVFIASAIIALVYRKLRY